MRKRQREDLCGVCGHYHKYEEGEVCGICGHQVTTNVKPTAVSASSPILPDFLYLGGFNDASSSVTLKFQGISHILNTVPSCSILYPRTFTYYRLEDEKALDLDKAIQFLEECEKKKFRVLVHCMSGKSRRVNTNLSHCNDGDCCFGFKQSSNNSSKSLKRSYLDQEMAVKILSTVINIKISVLEL